MRTEIGAKLAQNRRTETAPARRLRRLSAPIFIGAFGPKKLAQSAQRPSRTADFWAQSLPWAQSQLAQNRRKFAQTNNMRDTNA